MNGKLIVIEGTDGSGKATQTKLLAEYLINKKYDIELLDFPQYGQPSAFFIEKYLRGEYGSAEEVGPYRGSIFYALDRYDKSFEIKKWLGEEKIILSNRYASANMGHQAGKIDDLAKRDEYLDWVTNLEFDLLDIPKPDLVIFLYVPPEIGQKLVDLKEKRAYIKGKKRDIHEDDLLHLQKASNAFLYVAEKYNWTTINCTNDKRLRSREDIHGEIIKVLKEKRLIK